MYNVCCIAVKTHDQCPLGENSYDFLLSTTAYMKCSLNIQFSPLWLSPSDTLITTPLVVKVLSEPRVLGSIAAPPCSHLWMLRKLLQVSEHQFSHFYSGNNFPPNAVIMEITKDNLYSILLAQSEHLTNCNYFYYATIVIIINIIIFSSYCAYALSIAWSKYQSVLGLILNSKT